jgi:F0F1-type ATP synthase membrane subunit c/vacuolar-type H+-ATPase subunit K
VLWWLAGIGAGLAVIAGLGIGKIEGLLQYAIARQPERLLEKSRLL